MAKVQGKKTAGGAARRTTGKLAARVKTAARAVKKRVATAAPKKTARKAALKVAPRVAAKAASRPAPRVAAKPAPKVAKPARKAAAALPAKPVAVPAAKPKAAAAPRVVAPPPAPEPKKRTRRPRPRVQSNGAPVANWLPQGEKPRPSSFIPAPARAEAPSRVAAPPASSDRLIRPEDVTDFVTRTVPVRVDIEQSAGRVYLHVNPLEVVLRPGEGIEWDFRYLGGADITVDELVVELEKPSPFSHVTFRSRKPGSARPHRQLSGPVHGTAKGKRVEYTIRAMSPYKTELAVTRPSIDIK